MPMIIRRALPTIAICLGLWLPVLSCSDVGAERRNVVLVTLDTTRPDFFGAWGSEGDPTLHFDALAEEGVRFAMAVSASAVTPVSHASILTGQNPYTHRLRILAGQSGFRLPEEMPTLATTLHGYGYRTAAIHSAFPVSGIYGFDRGFDRFEEVIGSGLQDKADGAMGWDVMVGQRRSDETTERALDFLREVEEPFFLWIHYWDPHDPGLLPPDEFLRGKAPFGEDGRPIYGTRELYAAEVSYVDEQFGRVVRRLKERGFFDRTILTVVADHGEGLDDGLARHGWAAHRILYQEQIHVPLIVRIPGTRQGREVEALVRTIDIFPTLLDYLDVAPPGSVEGRSLRPLIEGARDEDRIAYADQINLWDANAGLVEQRPKADFLHVAMDDRWKLIYRPSYPEDSELYDYRADPGELKDLFAVEQEIATRLMTELAERAGWVLVPFTADGTGEGMSARNLSILNELGYTQGDFPTEPVRLDGHWEWLCPQDRLRHEGEGPCPRCGGECLPAARAR